MGFRSLIGVNLEYSAKNVPKLVVFLEEALKVDEWDTGIFVPNKSQN